MIIDKVIHGRVRYRPPTWTAGFETPVRAFLAAAYLEDDPAWIARQHQFPAARDAMNTARGES